MRRAVHVDKTRVSFVLQVRNAQDGFAKERDMKRLLVLVLSVVLTMPAAAMARGGRHWDGYPCRDCRDGYDGYTEARHGAYASFKVGLYMPEDSYDLLENGSSIGLALGSNLTRNFALEIGMNYDSADFRQEYTGGYDDAYVSTFSVPVTAKVIAPLSPAIDVFAGAGLGVYFSEIRPGSLWYEDPDDMVDREDTSLGVHTVIGSDIKVNPAMALNIELRYTAIAHDSDNDFHEVLGLDGTTATVGVKFRF